ncbi:D-2-hydroxyacid dehydrogenase [Calidifontibacillus oryziterrae]|uniref:D-2-hydroxyacid dehydrogenase n=1 Tax=Calidifontibacillus oryziterrae TaxID=1191699 RepID=UPI0002ED8C2D|nr:D-2-hydroxyacid dehydrogenase [Calidifontibacillus oryziterrae]
MKILTTFRVKTAIKEKLLEKYPNVNFCFKTAMKEAKEDLLDAEILITYGEDLNEQLIDTAKNLKWIMVLSAGMEKMPFQAIKEKGILVTNVRGIHKTPMAEYTIGMMLQVSRKTKQLIENEKNEIWDRSIQMIELFGKTITILGAGAIGTEIARLAKAFNMKTIGINRSGKPSEYIDEIYSVADIKPALKQGDFIVSVLPSTPETVHLLKEEHFAIMKNDAVFLNIGRGTVVAESVLMNALERNEIAHAVLDVFETEPLKEDHPFWRMENVTVTPHLSGLSALYQRRGFDIFEYNLEKYLKGENNYKNIIDLNRGY